MKSKKRSSRRKSFKVKLKKNTIYTLFSLGLIALSGLFFLSFLRNGDSVARINDILLEKFAGASFLFPLVPFFFAMLLLHLKIYLSRAHVAFGYLVFFVALLGLTKSGTVGLGMFHILEEILTTIGADLIFIAGAIIGVVVFFDTSADEIVKGVQNLMNNSHRMVPTSLFKRDPKSESSLDRSKPIIIKGGQQKDMPVQPLKLNQQVPNKKDEPDDLIAAKLITNVLGEGGNGIWEYPALSLLSEAPGAKAERGDINKTASLIEKTLQSFGVEAHVAEVNLGPAVTQYALEIALGTKVSKITSLANDLALATEAPTGQIRIEAPIPGRNLVGIEIPNRSLGASVASAKSFAREVIFETFVPRAISSAYCVTAGPRLTSATWASTPKLCNVFSISEAVLLISPRSAFAPGASLKSERAGYSQIPFPPSPSTFVISFAAIRSSGSSFLFGTC
jgi:S-DNA-T family DNA segregation ATPase FtsK/SpoIIIE